MKMKFNSICCGLLFMVTSVFGQEATRCVSEIKHSVIEMCANSQLQLDTILTKTSSVGTWSANAKDLINIVVTDSNTMAYGKGRVDSITDVTVYHTATSDTGKCTDSFIMRLKPAPYDIISGTSSVCLGITGKLEVLETLESYAWSTGETTQQISFNEAKTISVEVAASNGCKAIDSVKTVILQPTPVTIAQSGLPCLGKEVTLFTDVFSGYAWSDGSKDQSMKVNTTGEFSIEATNTYGCISRDTVSVKFESCAVDTTSCGNSSGIAYGWPGNRNWFVAGTSHTWEGYGYIFNSLTGDTTKVGGLNEKKTNAYEGTTAASDDEGNILFYSNGRQVFNGATEEVVYEGLLAGNEGMLRYSSASQGVITVRHPLDPDNYHVFTVDDAVAPIYGCNHFTLNKDGSLKNGPTRLGSYNTFEGIAATKHSNGVDIWVMVLAREGEFNAYLVTSKGVDLQQSNVAQLKASPISGDKLRGSLAFSWDGARMAMTHSQQWPRADQSLMIFDFNNTTGELSNRMDVSPTNVILGGYDLIFSPDNSRIYVSHQTGKLSFFDISSGVESVITSTYTQTSLDTRFSNLEIGADGKLYYGTVEGLKRIDVDVSTQTPSSSVLVTNERHSSLSTLYLQPSERVKITSEVGTVCNRWREYNLNAIWECSGKSAENHILISDTANGYFGAGVTNREQGVFNPDGLANGVYNVVFKMGQITDTLSITVENCDHAVCDMKVDKTITVTDSTATVAYAGAHSYVWLNCDLGKAPIEGLNTQTVSLDPGSYAVVVAIDANCKDTSECFIFKPVSVEGINAGNISIFPNPANETLNIQNEVSGTFTYEIVSILGESILKKTSSAQKITIGVNDLVPGTYFVKVSNSKGSVVNTPFTKR